jgi:hypothetical protein
MDFKDLEILRKGNSELRQELEKTKKERDKACKDYLELYAKLDKVKDLVKDKIKKEQHKIETNEYIVIFLEELGDLKEILDVLERRNVE